jgi:hypothetical protein
MLKNLIYDVHKLVCQDLVPGPDEKDMMFFLQHANPAHLAGPFECDLI